MTLDNDLSGALRTTTRQLTVRDLRKAKVENVRVIERSQLMSLLKTLELGSSKSDTDASQRRVQRLLHETAKLGKEKKDLEHAKGLVEAERGRLQASLDEVCQALSRETGEKLAEEDVRELLAERQKLRTQVTSLEQNIKRLQSASRDRLNEELGKNANLEGNLEETQTDRDRLERERERMESENEALRHDLEQYRDERDRTVDERDAMAAEREALRQERDGMRRERDTFREERDTYLKRCAQLGEDMTALRSERDGARREVAELQLAREVDVEQMAALTRAGEELTEKLMELQPEAEEETKTEESHIPAPVKSSRRKGSRGGGFSLGFGFGPKKS
jgi:hypothetical protein